jgi:plastocyanin
MRNRAEVAVAMSDISFRPASIIISPGTRVTWTNGDIVEHFVNTDSHPAHTYFLQQNSRGLAAGASFSVIFTQPGAYPYHCSAHAAQMTGMIVVE